MNLLSPWQKLYTNAVLETDNSALPQRIATAENAIKARISELEQDHHGTPQERMEISEALKSLGLLREERIKN